MAYGIEVYGAASNTCIHKLQVIQNRISKTLYNKGWYTSTSILHENLNILKIKDIFSLFQLVFVHNQQLGKLPDNFSDYFITRDTIHNRVPRYRKQIHLRQFKTNIGSKSVKVTGVALYNSLPVGIKSSTNIKVFSFFFLKC